EEALLAWFAGEGGVLVCAPTGTGKTLIAEAAMFEALHTGQTAYYTTPLIALTEQKFAEMQEAAERWGFSRDEVGLVTGNRRVNPDARILVVVAEILLNRLLEHDAFSFADVSAVVMDEFHSFNDPERGIVWEFSLGMLPENVRLMLLSATVGNAVEFKLWLSQNHNRRVDLIRSDDRKVPLDFRWIGDQLLTEQIELMASGNDEARYVPALVFCFNRDECWNVADQLKGKKLLTDSQRTNLLAEIEKHDWSQGAGPKLKQILQRGVGVHHAGVLPVYKRIVENLFQQKLLAITVCTETLAAGINLPARSVVIPNILKGPPDKKRLIDPSAAHQMFGRAGRPQFDSRGYVFALAHEDDVKILRWKEKYDQIPEDTKDPQLRRAKKQLKKKMPTRRANQKYWSEAQFEQLRTAPPANLESRGFLPWRLLAYMLDASPDVEIIRKLIAKRLMPDAKREGAMKQLDRMLQVLWTAGYVELEPKPKLAVKGSPDVCVDDTDNNNQPEPQPDTTTLFGMKISEDKPEAQKPKANQSENATASAEPLDEYKAKFAYPTEQMELLTLLRGVNPLFGIFAAKQMGIADDVERIQIFESILEMPGTVARSVRVPKHEELPPGPLATSRLDSRLLQLGLVTAEQLGAKSDEEEDDNGRRFYDEDERVWVLTIADKLKLLFDHDFPGVYDIRITPVWAAGEILEFGDFNKYVTSKRLQKQEGVLFRHLLRLILLLGEFEPIVPPELTSEEWTAWLGDLRKRLSQICQRVDAMSLNMVS
ncbi:MAG: DEAD/DEAH box helicase, partial [Planctomycetales bacterium]|nr:DEAD/DEAH box helicase [Planctomycetales bacterium]